MIVEVEIRRFRISVDTGVAEEAIVLLVKKYCDADIAYSDVVASRKLLSSVEKQFASIEELKVAA